MLCSVLTISPGLQPTRAMQDRAWYNKILWDSSGCCNMYSNEFWSLVRALFGYTGEMRVMQPGNQSHG